MTEPTAPAAPPADPDEVLTLVDERGIPFRAPRHAFLKLWKHRGCTEATPEQRAAHERVEAIRSGAPGDLDAALAEMLTKVTDDLAVDPDDLVDDDTPPAFPGAGD